MTLLLYTKLNCNNDDIDLIIPNKILSLLKSESAFYT
jgi:hypothetical protein